VARKIVIYTRYSTDMQREESCEDQEREVRQGLERLGIDARDAVVIYDRAESGTKNDRAKFEHLRATIARGEVGILAVDDQARFSRADNACAFVTDLVYHGGRFLSIGEGIDTDQEGWQLRVKVMELHNSTTIRELGRRVHRGQKGRVLDDGAAGDHPYGYASFYLDPDPAGAPRRGPKPKKGLRIYEPEAQWVRRAFDWFVAGMAIAEIARELTRLGVDKGRKATAPGWHHQQVRRMLANPKYVGIWPWGATKTLRNSDGKTKQVPVPADQQVVRQRPDLRIIEQATWEAAQERLRELEGLYGQKLGQKPRGAKPHHTLVYPKGLLGGLLVCHACGSRLWAQGSGGRAYMGCPNHRKGSCAMASRVPVAGAERALLGFAAELLTAWPPWVESAAGAMRRSIAGAAERLPETLRADERHLAELDKRVENLVDQLADGASDSPALRRRLDQSEREAEGLRGRIAAARRAQEAAVAMPEDAWIRAQLAELPSLLADDPRRSASLLRRLVGAVTAEAVVAPGKRRGFVRLHVRLEAARVLEEVLGGRLPEAVLASAVPSMTEEAREFHLDLGAPTRRDVLAPEVAALRARGVTWPEIGRLTGLGTGNAYNVWKRWAGAGPADHRAHA
jgi:DNA invertase Pin-like site-specific DNA recombinase